MPKDEKAKFDPQAFLDNYEDNVSSSLSKKKGADPSPSVKTKTQTETSDAQPSHGPDTDNRKLNPKKTGLKRKKPESVDLSDSERDYIDNFLVENVEVGFGRTGKQVPIAIEYHSIVTILRALHGTNVTIGGIVNNILREHYDLHEQEISSLLNKNSKLNTH